MFWRRYSAGIWWDIEIRDNAFGETCRDAGHATDVWHYKQGRWARSATALDERRTVSQPSYPPFCWQHSLEKRFADGGSRIVSFVAFMSAAVPGALGVELNTGFSLLRESCEIAWNMTAMADQLISWIGLYAGRSKLISRKEVLRNITDETSNGADVPLAVRYCGNIEWNWRWMLQMLTMY